MKKRCINLALLLLASTGTAAYADGTVEDYDHSDTAIARTLSPDEYLVNADGAQEDPSHRMSDTARAYRNGLIAGRKEAEAKQKLQQQQAAQLPPLPAGTTLAATDPRTVVPVDLTAAAPTAARPYRAAPSVAAEPAQDYAESAEYAGYAAPRQLQPQPYGRYAPPEQPPQPVQYVAQQNVYASAPVYAAQDDETDEAYAPPPPVYAPPAPRYIYLRPRRRMPMPPQAIVEVPPPVGYWSRPYVPAAPVAQPYAYQSYY